LLGLLHHLLADTPWIVEQLDRVGAGRTLACALAQCALQRGQRLGRRARVELAAVKAGALARMAGGTGRLDEREQSVAVAVHAQRADGLRVATRRALVPQLLTRAAPQVQLPGGAGALQRELVHV